MNVLAKASAINIIAHASTNSNNYVLLENVAIIVSSKKIVSSRNKLKRTKKDASVEIVNV